MKKITCIEDLPTKEMRKQARWSLLVYGNAFIYNTEEGPALLDPVQLLMIQVPRDTGIEYGTPSWLPHIKEIIDGVGVKKLIDANGDEIEGMKFEEFKEGELQRKSMKDWHLSGHVADMVLEDEND